MPSVLALLTDPDAFFRTRVPDPSLKGPLAVIVLIAAANAAAALVQSRFMSQVFESGGMGGGFATALQGIIFVFVIFGPFVIWLVYAGVFQGISALFDGDGEFSTTLAFTGWGFVPSVLGSVASIAINYYRFNVRGVDVPDEMSMEAYRQFSQSLQTGPLVALSATLALVFTLWSGFLWTFALKHARDLTLRRAALTIAFPTAIGLLATLRTLLVALEVL
ncbi:YIP1 family protein [Halosimplex aquaticum]|uniref:YIP1 family protein n=1 Tax=Halosimplex aquaticum TaxID=3026162 RepID=A0ABD5Y690_9EURY|nr:Yip1 family protein [Halosimplex aquaticum]